MVPAEEAVKQNSEKLVLFPNKCRTNTKYFMVFVSPVCAHLFLPLCVHRTDCCKPGNMLDAKPG